MDRKGHYVKPASRVGAPGVVFAVVAHPAHSTERAQVGLTELTWGTAEVAVCYYRDRSWTRVQELWVDSPDELREWMSARARPGRNNWVIAPDVSDTLTLSQWWTYAELRGCGFSDRGRADRNQRESSHDRGQVSIHRLVAGAGPEIVEYTDGGTRWRWVGARNYWPMGFTLPAASQRDMGRASERIPERRHVAGGRECHSARALLSRFRGLCDWWRRTARAPLGCTAGALAWGILRTHIGRGELCTHGDADAHTIERGAAHGGRASVFYVGSVGDNATGHTARRVHDARSPARSIPGPLHHLDVSSMYPALMRDQLFPTRIGSAWYDLTPRELVEMCNGNGVIARVRVRADKPEYPYRAKCETVYPIGEFTTTLAGPDLVALAGQGEILRVYHAQEYALGRPFARAMDALLRDRASYDPATERDAIAFSKLVANSLAGKTAQHMGGWTRCADRDEPGRWGFEQEISDREERVIRYRYLAGMCHRWDDDKTGRGPHTSAFAYLTAYGRQMMATLRALCPARSVVSQDTDGLWVTDAGLAALRAAGKLDRSGPGELRLTKTVTSAQFYGPKHYRANEDWTLSGYHEPLVSADRMTAVVTTRTPLSQQRLTSAPTSVHTVTRTVGIPFDLQGQVAGEDGWLLPRTEGRAWTCRGAGE